LLHDYESALKAYNKVIELSPGSAFAREAEKKAAKIRKSML